MIKDLIEILDEITWEILENNPKLEIFSREYGISIFKLEYHTGFGSNIVKFIGFEIWDSENDDREYIDNGEDEIYEDMRVYIYRKLGELNESGLTNLKLKL